MSAFRFYLLCLALALPFGPARADESMLTLAEAERLALAHAPWLAHHATNVDAAAERVVYAGQLPDPQLVLGLVNVPTDTYKLDRDDQTALNIGLRQSFPPGRSRAYRTERAQKELAREQARLEIERRNLLKQVRVNWLELYLQDRSLRLLEQARRLSARQVQDSEGRYRAAQEPQQALLRQRQALARLDERLATARAQRTRMQAQLARWIGAAAYCDLPAEAPASAPAPETFEPVTHPDWRAAQAGLEAAQAEVALAQEEYKPGFMLDLGYGRRRPLPDGTRRTDMASALLTLDLPLFRAERQDRRVAEKRVLETGARLETEDKRRELAAMYTAARAEHAALSERVQIFDTRLLPDIQREARVSAGFARDTVELRDAQLKELDAQLELLRLRVELGKSQAELLYLTGEPQS